MKRKFEEKVAQLAFGDLSADDAAKLEQEVQSDPEALRALSQYKDMREGLKSLAEVPDDQLSKERLRDAILTQGLKPVPTRRVSPHSWLWMPGVACSLGFVLMFGVNRLHHKFVAPNIVINPPKNYSMGSAFESNSESSKRFIEKPTMVASATKTMPKNSRFDAAAAQVDPDIVDSRITASNLSGGFEDAAYDADLGNEPVNGQRVMAGERNLTARNDATLVSTNSTTGPIVLIDQDKDDQTGACKATEVGSASNVLVGG
jgi:hypothetical protein